MSVHTSGKRYVDLSRSHATWRKYSHTREHSFIHRHKYIKKTFISHDQAFRTKKIVAPMNNMKDGQDLFANNHTRNFGDQTCINMMENPTTTGFCILLLTSHLFVQLFFHLV